MQTFNSTNIITKFIKELVSTTNILNVPVWLPKTPLISQKVYVADKYIVKAKKDSEIIQTKGEKIDNGELILGRYSGLIPYIGKEVYKEKYSSTGVLQWEGPVTLQDFDTEPITGGGYYIIYYKLNKELVSPSNIYNSEYFEILAPYIEGEEYVGITTKCSSNTSTYDADTHYHLGQYLRQLRGLHGIDLMPYYNCWDGSRTDKYRITTSIDEQLIPHTVLTDSVSTDGYKLLTVPVKLNQQYTLYLNSDTPIKYGFAYYDGTNVISSSDDNILVGNDRVINSSTYSEPILIKSPELDDIYRTYPISINNERYYLEDYLTLFLQVPADNSTSIVVLEGNYCLNKLIKPQLIKLSNGAHAEDSDITTEITKVVKFIGNSTDNTLDVNNLITSPSSLTINGVPTTYLFNDRLVEYLLYNVVTHIDPLYKNIVYAQRDTSTQLCKNVNGLNYENPIYGEYDSNYRYFIYRLVTETIKNPSLIDINGFIDKDSEKVVITGRNRNLSKWGKD